MALFLGKGTAEIAAGAKVNRSRLLTQAAIELLIRKTRADRPDLEQWLASEKEDLDEMWSYLNFRDKQPKI